VRSERWVFLLGFGFLLRESGSTSETSLERVGGFKILSYVTPTIYSLGRLKHFLYREGDQDTLHLVVPRSNQGGEYRVATGPLLSDAERESRLIYLRQNSQQPADDSMGVKSEFLDRVDIVLDELRKTNRIGRLAENLVATHLTESVGQSTLGTISNISLHSKTLDGQACRPSNFVSIFE
jgi:hypothetical protein